MSVEAARGGRAVFRHRDYRLCVSGRFLWGLALQIQTTAVAWLVYDLTHDALALGFIGLAAFLPTVPLSLITGTAADRLDRRLLLIASYGVMTLASLALVFVAKLGLVWPIYIIVLLVGAGRAFSNPPGQALMASSVPAAEYPNAAAWSNSINQTATVVGPSIGGLLYPLGSTAPFMVAFGLFFIATILSCAISPGAASGERKPPVTFSTLVAGYLYIWNSPAMLGAVTLDLVAVLLGGATSLLPIYANEIFHTGPWGLGLLRSSPAAGSIVTALVMAHMPLSRRVGKTMFYAVIVYGLATIGFGLSTNIWLAMVFLAILGGADIVGVVIRQSMVLIGTPDAMRGRVNAVTTILTGASNNLGEFESGAVASMIGAVPTVVLGGAGAVIVSLAWMRLFPTLRDREGIVN